jgi:hypothetical protein
MMNRGLAGLFNTTAILVYSELGNFFLPNAIKDITD